MERDARLIQFHIHRFVHGDDVDRVVERLYGWGALHVQPARTVGPDGGTAYTVLVEIASDDEWRFARDLAATMGVARYHRLASTYCYQPVTTGERPIIARCDGAEVGMTVRFQLIGTERKPLYVRVIDDDLRVLHDRLAETCGVDAPLPALQQRLQGLLAEETGFVLELDGLAERGAAR